MRKKILVCLMIAVMTVASFAACGGSGSTSGSNSAASSIEANTIGTKLQVQFLEEAASTKDVEAIANKLIENKELEEMSMIVMPVEEGFLNGFESDITGFNKGAVFAPMIGTIPFVGYVFETDDVEGLKATLESNAMLNWNICTVADEMVIDSVDNLVFFVMAPNSFDE